MEKKIIRRNFLKQSLVAAGGAALVTQTSLFAGDGAENNDTLKTIQNLRTIHGNFNDKQIPADQVNQVLQASIRAANASNMQTYSIIVVKDKNKMKSVCGYTGSCMFVYCVDYNRLKKTAGYLGYDFYMNDVTAFITGSMNAMLAAQTAVIAAKSIGIDSLLTNGLHRGDIERQWGILGLPEKDCFPLISLVLGYTDEEPSKKGRLDGPGVFHDEEYHNLSEEEIQNIIARYDDKNAHIALNEDWDKQGHKHFYDWLCKSWLQGIDKPTTEESQMLKLLKRSGFIEA
jgi:nitroreductase